MQKRKWIAMMTGSFLMLSIETVSAAETMKWEPIIQVERNDENTQGKLAILYTGNTRGKGFEKNRGYSISFATLFRLKTELQEAGYEVVLLDSGDAWQGTVFVNHTKGAGAVEFMNAVGYDAMVLGSHEFDWGTEALLQNAQTADFPILAANLYMEDALLFEPFQMITTEQGWSIGILGIADAKAGMCTVMKDEPDVFFAPKDILYEELQQYTLQMKEECDLLICMGDITSLLTEQELFDFQNVDIVLNGTDEGEEQYLKEDTFFSGTSKDMEAIGYILIEESQMQTGWITLDQYSQKDLGMSAFIYEKHASLEEELSAVIGASAVDLVYETEQWECNLGDLAADALLWQGKQIFGPKVSASIVRGSELQAEIEKGDLCGSLFYKIFPMEYSACTVTLTGAQLQQLLANLSYPTNEQDDYFQVAGITCNIDLTCEEVWEEDSPYRSLKAAKKRIQIETVGLEAFDEEKEYQIMISEDLLQGWALDEALLTSYEKSGATTGIFMADVLENYVSEGLNGLIDDAYRMPRGRIIVLTE